MSASAAGGSPRAQALAHDRRDALRSALRRAWVRLRCSGTVEIDPSAHIGAHVRIEVDRGARLRIAAGCAIEPHVRIFVRSGTLELGTGVLVRERASVVVLERVSIGARVDVGERATIVDLRPPIDDVEAPLRKQAVRAEGIEVGDDVAIGPSAVLETGARIPPGTRVEAGVAVSRLGETARAASAAHPQPAPPMPAAHAQPDSREVNAATVSATITAMSEPQSQAARHEQIVREVFEAFTQRDATRARALLAPGIVLEAVSGQVLNEGRPYIGHEGIGRYFADVEANWRELTVRPTQVRAAGRAVVALGHTTGVAARGAVRDAPTTWVFKFEGDLVSHVQIFSDPELARRALAGEGSALEGDHIS